MLKLRNVSKTYGKSKTKAVDDISFDVHPGEIFGFLGPNGAGKTTTLKMITGILNPSRGSIIVDNVDVTKYPLEAKQKIGYVSDTPEVFTQLKALEYLNFIADVYNVDGDARRRSIERFTRLFGIAEVLSNSISGFSHGMKQKLMLTASLLSHPPLWILDEPMVGLDPKSSFDLKTLMREHADSGHSVVFSTHVMEVAERVCDRIAIINGGKIVFVGTLAELREMRGEDGSLEHLFLELVEEPASQTD